jgi:outer membrane receptor for ferrienterochelin and colicins
MKHCANPQFQQHSQHLSSSRPHVRLGVRLRSLLPCSLALSCAFLSIFLCASVLSLPAELWAQALKTASTPATNAPEQASAQLLAQASVQSVVQDSTASKPKKPKPTRAQVLKMKIEDLLDLPIEDVTELLEIVGVSSLDELINLLVTTASKAAEKLQDAPGIITVVTSKEIEAFGGTSMVEVLDRVVSLYFAGTAIFPQNMLITRGIAQENYTPHVLYLIDGRPFRESNVAGYVSPLPLAFPLSSIDRIEIVRGPGSVLYGTSAYAGVINVITKSGGDGDRLKATARYGSFGTAQGEVAGGTKIGNLEIAGGVNFLNSTGWDFTARGETDVIRTRDSTRDSILRDPKTIKMFTRNLGANLKLGFKGLTLNSYFGSVYQADMGSTPAWAAVTNRPLTDAERTNPNIVTPANTIERANIINRLLLDLGYSTEILSGWNASLNVTYNNANHRFLRLDPDFKDDDIQRVASDFLVELTNYIKPMDNMNIVVGALLNNQSGFALLKTSSPVPGKTGLEELKPFNIATGVNPDPFYSIAPYNQAWFTGYFQGDYRPVEWLKIIAGGQLNKVTDLPLDFVPRLGVIVNATDELRFKTLFGQAFRSASAFERSTVSMPNILGTPGLRPEKITTFEAQVNYTTSDIDLALTYFNSTERDRIRRSVPGLPPSVSLPWLGTTRSVPVHVNDRTLYWWGLEFEGKAQVGNGFSLFGSAAYQTNREEGTDDVDIIGSPRLMVKAGVMYQSPLLTGGVFASYFGEGGDITEFSTTGKVITRQANPPVRPFTNLTFNAALNLGKLFGSEAIDGLALNVYGSNLLGEEIYMVEYIRRNINSLPARQGRALYVGLQMTW